MGRIAHLGLAYRVGDAGDPDSLASAIAGCEVVVNLTKGDPREIVRTTQNVHAAAFAAGARLLIHLSSAAIYGATFPAGLPDDAPPRLDHWMPYAREKGRAENFLRARMADPALSIVVLRPMLIWGPGSPYVLGSAISLMDGTAWLVGDGRGICGLVYVDNLVRAILAVAAHPAPAAGSYHVADDETTTWGEYYGALAAGLGVDPSTIHRLPAGAYRAGIGDALDGLRGSDVYRWVKDRVPQETRAALKLRLAAARSRGASAGRGAHPAVTRELWELQTMRYRLPTAKFAATFTPTSATPFSAGMAASLAWLGFIGIDDAAA
jgi:nucleoside-diphosphate-sugar epimerase